MERRRNQFLFESGAVLTAFTAPSAGAPNPVTPLPNGVIDIRRASFTNSSTGATTLLTREDQWTLTSFLPGWGTMISGSPRAYSVTEQSPFLIRLMPAPQVDGQLNLVGVLCGATLNPAQGVLLGVPDDFTWVVKWGALADLLSKDSPAADPLRADYCQKRWQEGILAARYHTTVLGAQIAGVSTRVETVFELDFYSPNWHNANGAPSLVAIAGHNLIAPNQVPDQAYGLTLDYVANAPVSSPTAVLPMSPSVADVIVGYAEHLAAFKMGGEEFLSTERLRAFVELGSVYSEKNRANSHFWATIQALTTKEEKQRWLRTPVFLQQSSVS
jgi:hypothetical protein